MKNISYGMFQGEQILVPPTEGIKYAGSKLKLLPYILELVKSVNVHSILDGFSGSTRVSQMLAQLGYKVTSNDVSAYSKVFATAYLKNRKSPQAYKELFDHLNHVKPVRGWFSENYGGMIDDVKKPFQLKNTMKLDAIRQEIDNLKLSNVEKNVALSSLILALDKVDSTMGHFSSYLAQWSPRSFNDLYLKVPSLWINKIKHDVVQKDIFDVLKNSEFDLCYFDPPYGSNNEKMPPSRVRYGSYYHIWTTVALNDKPKLFGKVNRREDSRDLEAGSVFEEFRKNEDGKYIAMQAVERMIRLANTKYIILSYSSGGRATKEELYDIINSNGKLVKAVEVDYKKNVMGSMRWTNEWIYSDGKCYEYLFLIKK